MTNSGGELARAAAPDAGTGLARAAFWCAYFCGGAVLSLVIFGVLQERITSEPYDGELYRGSGFLVLVTRGVTTIVAGLFLLVRNNGPVAPEVPIWKYMVISSTNVGAAFCQYEALAYVNFIVQMLGKSFKMIPVMLWGIAISRKSYGLKDWAVACGVTGGVTLFLCTGPVNPKMQQGSQWVGLVLLFVFLAFDGFTGTYQEKVFREHRCDKYNMLFYLNAFATLVSFVLCLLTNDLLPPIQFCVRHPRFLFDVGALGILVSCAMFFVVSIIKEYGALVAAATFNVRQVVSIFVSYAEFHHSITVLQVVSLICVFGALGAKIYSALNIAIPGEVTPLNYKEATMETEKATDKLEKEV